MCGIIGYIGYKKASEILSLGLKALEYRGYDSVGISTISKNKVHIRKDTGKIDEISKRLRFEELTGNIGIGHTRWATHGIPCMENAHPHADCNRNIVLVHNGIIENYAELKYKLKGHKFSSDTDSEVIAHLIEDYIDNGSSPFDAFVHAIRQLKGSYAIITAIKGEDKLFFARNKSPLIIGIGENEMFLASDYTPVLRYTNKVVSLHDGEYGYVNQFSVHVFSDDIGDKNACMFKEADISGRVETIKWTHEMVEKGGYKHYMLKEIHEQKETIEQVMRADINPAKELITNHKKIHIVACGTSYHAGMVMKYLLARYTDKIPDVFVASEYRFTASPDDKTLVIAITQSGETADVLDAVRYAKHITNNRCKVLAITNVIGSAITKISDKCIFLNAGPEIGVAATKTFTSQLIIVFRIVFENEDNKKLLRSLMNKYLLGSYKHFNVIERVAKKMHTQSSVFFIGRGISYPIAKEGALKLKEISYIHAEAYPAGELKHGPLSLIENGVYVVVLSPNDRTIGKMHGNIKEVKARGGTIVALTDSNAVKEDSDFVIPIDTMGKKYFDKIKDKRIMEDMYVFSMIIPLQYLAYVTSVEKRLDPDKPRNLAKSVTVE